MEFYVAVRTRNWIDPEWLDQKINEGYRDIFGPFHTISDADEQYDRILKWVDDDDYGIYARDNKKRWWLIRTHRDGTCSYRRMYYGSEYRPANWKESLTVFVANAINAEHE